MYNQLNGTKECFNRTNSICPTPSSVLLDLVLRNDREHILQLCSNNKHLLSHIYQPDYNKPILLIACSEDQVEADTVQILIDLGADLHYASEIDEAWQPIHFAAWNTKSDTLRVIVKNLKNPGDINALAKGYNALHVLIKQGKSELEEFVTCTRILVEEGIDVNQGDGDNVSAILWAAKKGYKNIIKIILERSVVPVDIDSHRSRNKTAREIILSKNLYDGPLPDQIDNSNETDESILFKYLHSQNENGFVNYKNGDIYNFVNADNKSSTLLQLCCDKCLVKAATHLINKGADPNLTIKSNPHTPLDILAENGCYEIFEIILGSSKTHIPPNILFTLLKCIDNEEYPGISHGKCFDILVEKLKNNTSLDINELDDSNNSALHYAIRYAECERVEKLLQLGASLGTKNKYNVMPIQDIEPKMLEKHLDNCVEFDLKGTKLEKEDFSVTFNYRTLIPPAKKSEYQTSYDTSDPETNLNNPITDELVAETEVIAYMSKAPEFKHLLKHPVIVSFLFMKWHRIRWLFYTNLAFYITFVLSLVVYIFTIYARFNKEKQSSFEDFIVTVSFCIFLVTHLILVFREIFQIAVSPTEYFKNFDNYVEIILIVITGCILYIHMPSDDTKKILSSVSILLAAFELVLMVGQHPKLSTNVVMLETVSLNFFKFLIWYSLLILAFALSFYILFSETDPSSQNDTENEDDSFTDPGKSVFKTIVMLTGEFDAGSLNFHHFPITSKVMFSLFVFMIAIILLNLLNGLAVSDTQMIKNNAELVGHISRAQHIHYVESMALGNILPRTLIHALGNICCCIPVTATYNFPNWKPLAKWTCLFPHGLGYKLTIYPNKGNIEPQIQTKHNLYRKSCIGGSSFCLNKETIYRTNNIIRQRRETNIKQEDMYIRKIQNIFKALEENANNNKTAISILSKKVDYLINSLSCENKS